jgi:hypothetical protein
MDGVSAGACAVESSSAAILMPSGAERSIATPRLCTEIIEDSLPHMAHSERTHLRVAMGAGLAQPQVTDMRAHLEATRGHPTASPAAIAGQPLTGAPKLTEPTQATGDSPAANELSLDANQARRALLVSAAAAVGRADVITSRLQPERGGTYRGSKSTTRDGKVHRNSGYDLFSRWEYYKKAKSVEGQFAVLIR